MVAAVRVLAGLIVASLAVTPLSSLAAELRSGIDAAAVDPAVRPQDDYFRHVNGRWLKTTEMPADKAYIGSFETIHERVQLELRGLVERAPKAGDADARRVADLYASFVDEAGVEKAGLGPLRAELAAIDALTSRAQLAGAMGRLARLGAESPIGFYVNQDARDATRYVPIFGQDGLGLPDRDYYLVAGDAKFAQARSAYTAYVARLLELSGSSAADAQDAAASVLVLETDLARGQWSRVDQRDPVRTYNRYEIMRLDPLVPGFDWPAYFAAAGLAGKSSDVIVREPSYLPVFAGQLAGAPLPVWKAYLKARLLDAYAPYLPKAFVDARFAFVGTTLSGVAENQPRWKRGLRLIESAEGEALGKVYVERYFSADSKARMEALVANLLAAYRESIDSLDWMGPETKKQAQAKLATFAPKIGYPKRWRDYGTLEIRPGDLAGNVMRANAFELDRNLAKLGRPVDRDEWHMTPQTVNAYYNPTMNEIVFPASVLQPPFFDPAADDALNYGAIGAIIGHEISHGFDDKGSQYDGSGNLRQWWTADDRKRFEAKTRALVAQYSAFSPLPGYTLNGELTLGENIADNSGLEIAYKAYQRSLGGKPAPVIDGATGDERFFAGFAQAFRGKVRDAALLRQIKSDPHSPEEFRVNGVVRNHPAFYRTFGVKPGDGMYLPPEQRVSVW